MRRPAFVRGVTISALAIAAGARLAAAHVAPSVDDNNRYAKLTPLGDRVRLAYTVFFGEIPGAAARQAIDANHDGQISADEASHFGSELAGEVSAAADLIVDGVQTKIVWTTIDVGITPQTAGGSFSVDLVTGLCLASARGHHELRYRDHFHMPHAGETEIKVEDSPGVKIERARVGAADDPSMDFRFVGPAGPFSDDGLELAFTAGDHATITADGACDGATARGGGGHGALPWLIGGVVMVVGAGAGFSWYRRSRRR